MQYIGRCGDSIWKMSSLFPYGLASRERCVRCLVPLHFGELHVSPLLSADVRKSIRGSTLHQPEMVYLESERPAGREKHVVYVHPVHGACRQAGVERRD